MRYATLMILTVLILAASPTLAQDCTISACGTFSGCATGDYVLTADIGESGDPEDGTCLYFTNTSAEVLDCQEYTIFSALDDGQKTIFDYGTGDLSVKNCTLSVKVGADTAPHMPSCFAWSGNSDTEIKDSLCLVDMQGDKFAGWYGNATGDDHIVTVDNFDVEVTMETGSTAAASEFYGAFVLYANDYTVLGDYQNSSLDLLGRWSDGATAARVLNLDNNGAQLFSIYNNNFSMNGTYNTSDNSGDAYPVYVYHGTGVEVWANHILVSGADDVRAIYMVSHGKPYSHGNSFDLDNTNQNDGTCWTHFIADTFQATIANDDGDTTACATSKGIYVSSDPDAATHRNTIRYCETTADLYPLTTGEEMKQWHIHGNTFTNNDSYAVYASSLTSGTEVDNVEFCDNKYQDASTDAVMLWEGVNGVISDIEFCSDEYWDGDSWEDMISGEVATVGSPGYSVMSTGCGCTAWD